MGRFGRFVTPLVFVVVGGVALALIVTTALFAGVPEGYEWRVAVAGVLATSFVIAGYGMLRGFRWGWFLGLAVVVLDIAGNLVYGDYVALAFDAFLALLLLLTAKHYGVRVVGRLATTPAPPPTAPIATAFMTPRNEKRFVRRKHRY